MTRCLVTGIAGFIGSSIAAALLRRGLQVVGVDNLSTGKLSNVTALDPRVEFIQGDICDAALMQSVSRGVDVVFHQAAIASVQRSVEDPGGTFDTNVTGTHTVLNAARKAGVRRFVFASSSAIYGDTTKQPCSERNLYNPMSPYAAHKLNCELMLQDAWLNHGMETVCLRYFNVFGPRQSADSPYSGAIVSFVKSMLRPGGRGPVTIYGDGAQTRDFIFIDDVVAANLAAMTGPAQAVAGAAFNVGTGRAQSILQVARTVADLVGYQGTLMHVPGRPGDVRHSLADVRLAADLLDFKAKASFREGLAETIGWMIACSPKREEALAAEAHRRPQPTAGMLQASLAS